MSDATNTKRSNAPLFWLPFGAGGMLSALFGPGMILITGIIGPTKSGFLEQHASYERALAFAHNPLGKLILLGVISLFFWHGAERLFLTLKDMRVGSVPALKLATYGVAAAVTLATAGLLLGL